MTLQRNEKLLKSFGKRVRELRKKVNLSQEQLAFDANIPISQIGRIERGEINPSLSTIFQIAKALNINLSVLFNKEF